MTTATAYISTAAIWPTLLTLFITFVAVSVAFMLGEAQCQHCAARRRRQRLAAKKHAAFGAAIRSGVCTANEARATPGSALGYSADLFVLDEWPGWRDANLALSAEIDLQHLLGDLAPCEHRACSMDRDGLPYPGDRPCRYAATSPSAR